MLKMIQTAYKDFPYSYSEVSERRGINIDACMQTHPRLLNLQPDLYNIELCLFVNHFQICRWCYPHPQYGRLEPGLRNMSDTSIHIRSTTRDIVINVLEMSLTKFVLLL